jgi:hypothetical protein
MSEQTTPNPETMSLDELRKLANEELAAANQPEPKPAAKTEQKRDENGQFVSEEKKDQQTVEVDEPAEPADEPAEDEPKLYRRIIDIGDGAGPEVFEADSLEGLVDKIADAKGHATKKIREQEKQLRELAPKQPAAKEFSKDDEYVFSQELMSKPTEAIKKIFKELTGYEIADFASIKQATDAANQAQAKSLAASTFLAAHPDYKDSTKNSTAMRLAMQGKAVTSETLHKAYLELKESGLLELQDEKAKRDGQDTTKQEADRIENQPVETVTTPRTRKASGISTQNRPAVRPVTEPTEDEAYTMPMEQLRALANKQLASGR